MKLLVCGSRHYSECGRMEAHLDAIRREHPDLTIACGYDPNDPRHQGADQLAYKFEIPYYGRCRCPAEGGSQCIEHATNMCDGCGAPATHACSGWVGSFVCCFPLCDNCEGDHEHAVWPMKPAHRPKLVCEAAEIPA